uniref:Putative ovule protein n=1 Tax=Solanum chacoense TaxID=4108 RepID=A0A0V0HFB9_SOLCH
MELKALNSGLASAVAIIESFEFFTRRKSPPTFIGGFRTISCSRWHCLAAAKLTRHNLSTQFLINEYAIMLPNFINHLLSCSSAQIAN